MDQEFGAIESLSEWESFMDSNRVPESSIGLALNRLLELTTADFEVRVLKAIKKSILFPSLFNFLLTRKDFFLE